MTDYGPHSDVARGGSTPVNLTHMWRQQRARVDPVAEFNDTDRKWRQQYLADKKLSHNDGNILQVARMPEFLKERYNIFRRIGRFPLDLFENALIKGGVQLPHAMAARRSVGVFSKILLGVWILAWNLNDDNYNNWEYRATPKIHKNKPYMDPDSPYYADMKATFVEGRSKPEDYYDNGFKKSTLYK